MLIARAAASSSSTRPASRKLASLRSRASAASSSLAPSTAWQAAPAPHGSGARPRRLPCRSASARRGALAGDHEPHRAHERIEADVASSPPRRHRSRTARRAQDSRRPLSGPRRRPARGRWWPVRANLIHTLLEHGLIDEFRLWIFLLGSARGCAWLTAARPPRAGSGISDRPAATTSPTCSGSVSVAMAVALSVVPRSERALETQREPAERAAARPTRGVMKQ
jgi:hypothetical protein